jgi:hypothetical protein
MLGFPIDLSESDTWFQQEDKLNQILSQVDPTTLAFDEAYALADTPPNTDPNIWIYEWLRYSSSAR